LSRPCATNDRVRPAIRFLTETLGLTVGEVTHGADGQVVHAELGWRNGTIMVSSRGKEPGPFDTGRACLYLVVEDPDGAHERAVAAGAEIVMPLVDQDYGSREFATREPGGQRVVASAPTSRPRSPQLCRPELCPGRRQLRQAMLATVAGHRESGPFTRRTDAPPSG